MKKVLSFVLVLSLVLGSMGMAFAAPSFTDVDDEDVLKAVERLSAFGIVNGYEDGTYKPEGDITRAEFAKMLVEALGLGSAAGATGSSQFSDVNASAWYAGYVSVAAGQGLVTGYTDGTFGPTKNVSYAEAVTMLVRALGYKDSFLPGSWPGNYVAKAAELDVTDDVTFVAGGSANRGAVAVMLNNTLDAKVIKQTAYGDDNQWSDKDTKPLLEEKLGFVKIKEVQVDDIPRFNKNLNDDEVSIDGDVYENISNINFDGLWGLEVNIYVDGDELVYAESTDAFKVYYDMVDAEGPKSATKEAGSIDNDTSGEDGEITLVKADDDFELVDEDDMEIYLYDSNGNLVTGSAINEYSELEAKLNTGKVFGKFVVNGNNEIQYMELYMSSEVDAGIVTSVDLDRETIEYYGLDANERKVDLTDEDGYKVYDAEFNTMELKDIEENNVVYVQLVDDKASGDTLHYVFVITDNTVAGELEEFDAGDEEIQLDGDDYDIGRVATVSIDENDTIIDKNDSDFWDTVEDALDEEVTLVFDMVGQVRHMTTKLKLAQAICMV
jgi:S-layer family protein